MGVHVVDHNIICPLGSTSLETFKNSLDGQTGIQLNADKSLGQEASYVAQIPENQVQAHSRTGYSKLESLMISSIEEALNNTGIQLQDENTILILSTTKGNIDALIPNNYLDENRAYLSELSKSMQEYFTSYHTPILISNACISGGCAIELAQDFLLTKRYTHAVVCGGDLLTEFVLSGFKSFHAVSEEPCKPYDKNRTGINLGEAVATVVLSSEKNASIQLLAASTSNDANHISGPSRTGEGLYLAVNASLKKAGLVASDINYISAHGTATNYNDEMESIAFERCGLQQAPLNSYKGYFGHTLGAAGIIESIMACLCLEHDQLIQSKGYEEKGVSGDVQVIDSNAKQTLRYVLKTGSGFGGGNNALIFGKI